MSEWKLTADEVALLRAIVRWRREMGIEYSYAGACYRDDYGVTVMWDYSAGPEIGYVRKRGDRITWIAVGTLTEAVDILVSFGLLPVRFSSAYREGWDANSGARHGSDDHWESVRPPRNIGVRA